MNKTEKTGKACNSLVFENGAMELTYGMITTEDVKGFPLELGEVGTNKVVAPENEEEAKKLAGEAKSLKAKGIRVVTKETAEKRIRRGRTVTKARTTVKRSKSKTEGAAR